MTVVLFQERHVNVVFFFFVHMWHVSQMSYSLLPILAVLCLFVFGYALEGLNEVYVFQLKAIICLNRYELLQ